MKLSNNFNLRSYHAGFAFAAFAFGAAALNVAAANMSVDFESSKWYIKGAVECGLISAGAAFLSNTARKLNL